MLSKKNNMSNYKQIAERLVKWRAISSLTCGSPLSQRKNNIFTKNKPFVNDLISAIESVVEKHKDYLKLQHIKDV